VSRRTLLLLGLWAAAFLAFAGAKWALDENEPEPRVASAPIHRASAAAAAGGSRVALPVEALPEGPPASYRGDRRHSGRSAALGPSAAALRFRFETGGRVVAQPVIGPGGRLYVGSLGGHLFAIEPDGRAAWEADLRGPIYGTPYVSPEGTVYVGSDAGFLFALDAGGRTVFELATEAEADTGVTPGPEGRLYFAAGDDLWSITAGGEVRWRFRAGGKIFTTPAVDQDGTIYVGSQDDHLYAVTPEGELRWAFAAGGDVDSSPVIGDGGTIFFGSDDRHFYAVDRDGRLRFRAPLDGMIRAPAALGADGSVLVGTYGPRPRVVALDAEDGETRWSFPVSPSDGAELGVASGPLVDRAGSVYFGAHDDFLYALTSDGHLRFAFEAGGDVDTPPILDREGTLYFGSDDGRLYALTGASPEDEP
jgi:outer membrane protein assembly factor BamB